MPEPSPSPTPTSGLDLDDFLCFALHSAAQAAVRANKPALDALGLTYPQFLAMAALWAADGQTVGGLGAKLFLESSTLTPLLKRLEAAGLVERARCAEDERQVRVRLTEKGRALRDEARKRRPDWVAQAFDDPEGAKALKQAAVALRDRLLLLGGGREQQAPSPGEEDGKPAGAEMP